ncbi:hypothetical protein [Streptomyces wedmorensis]|uniref:hypothetical protein n=1 Tax=Streptomyces wedmorensis TaxID=43759 RepID=UPI003799DD42
MKRLIACMRVPVVTRQTRSSVFSLPAPSKLRSSASVNRLTLSARAKDDSPCRVAKYTACSRSTNPSGRSFPATGTRPRMSLPTSLTSTSAPARQGVHEEHLLRGPAVVETARQRLEVQRAVQRAVPVGEDVRREEGGVRPERDAVAAEVEDQPGLVVVAAVLPLRDGGHDVVDGRRFTTCPTFVLGWTKGAGAVSLSRSARLPNGLASSWY